MAAHFHGLVRFHGVYRTAHQVASWRMSFTLLAESEIQGHTNTPLPPGLVHAKHRNVAPIHLALVNILLAHNHTDRFRSIDVCRPGPGRKCLVFRMH